MGKVYNRVRKKGKTTFERLKEYRDTPYTDFNYGHAAEAIKRDIQGKLKELNLPEKFTPSKEIQDYENQRKWANQGKRIISEGGQSVVPMVKGDKFKDKLLMDTERYNKRVEDFQKSLEEDKELKKLLNATDKAVEQDKRFDDVRGRLQKEADHQGRLAKESMEFPKEDLEKIDAEKDILRPQIYNKDGSENDEVIDRYFELSDKENAIKDAAQEFRMSDNKTDWKVGKLEGLQKSLEERMEQMLLGLADHVGKDDFNKYKRDVKALRSRIDDLKEEIEQTKRWGFTPSPNTIGGPGTPAYDKAEKAYQKYNWDAFPRFNEHIPHLGTDKVSPQKYVTRYHTTPAKNLNSIMQNGLKATRAGSGFGSGVMSDFGRDRYGGVYTTARAPWISNSGYSPIGNRMDGVPAGEDLVTLELNIPKEVYSKSARLATNPEEDWHYLDDALETVQNGGRTDIFVGDIPRDYITNVFIDPMGYEVKSANGNPFGVLPFKDSWNGPTMLELLKKLNER